MFGMHFFAGRRAALCAVLALVLCAASACAVPPAVPEATTAVETPAPTPACDVPDLQFETESYARETLTARGMNIDVEYVATSDIPAGLVAEQSVKPGDCPVEDAPVKLLVSVPTPTPEPTPEPTPTPKSSSKKQQPQDITEGQIPAQIPANPFPNVTPQPTWNIDMGLFDPSMVQHSTGCG